MGLCWILGNLQLLVKFDQVTVPLFNLLEGCSAEKMKSSVVIKSRRGKGGREGGSGKGKRVSREVVHVLKDEGIKFNYETKEENN